MQSLSLKTGLLIRDITAWFLSAAAHVCVQVSLPSADASSTGRVTATWVMFTVAVTPSSMKFYVDGLVHPGSYDFTEANQVQVNVANPDPSILNVSFTGFNLAGSPILLGAPTCQPLKTPLLIHLSAIRFKLGHTSSAKQRGWCVDLRAVLHELV